MSKFSNRFIMNSMDILLPLGILLLSLLALFLVAPSLKTRLRSYQLTHYEFPPAWDRILRESFPLYSFLGPKTQKRFQQQLQVALGTKEFFSAGSLEIENRHRLLCLAPLIIFSNSKTSDFCPSLKRILILDDEFDEQALLKEDHHDLCVRWDHRLQRAVGISAKNQGLMSTKTKKLIQKYFHFKDEQLFMSASLIWQYEHKYKKGLLSQAPFALKGVQQEIYIDHDVYDEMIWAIHELLCYGPEDVKKVLKDNFKDFLSYYNLNT